MQKEMVVEVACLVDFDQLDHDDRNEQGECSVDGRCAKGSHAR
jgi:hypothetical protein